MTIDEAMQRIDALASHVWMVRTFVKHSEEGEEDDELQEIVRTLYDFCLSLGPAWNSRDAVEYLKLVRKKLSKLRQSALQFEKIQPEVSAHTNFKMAVNSLKTALADMQAVLQEVGDSAADQGAS